MERLGIEPNSQKHTKPVQLKVFWSREDSIRYKLLEDDLKVIRLILSDREETYGKQVSFMLKKLSHDKVWPLKKQFL